MTFHLLFLIGQFCVYLKGLFLEILTPGMGVHGHGSHKLRLGQRLDSTRPSRFISRTS